MCIQLTRKISDIFKWWNRQFLSEALSSSQRSLVRFRPLGSLEKVCSGPPKLLFDLKKWEVILTKKVPSALFLDFRLSGEHIRTFKPSYHNPCLRGHTFSGLQFHIGEPFLYLSQIGRFYYQIRNLAFIFVCQDWICQ